MIFELVKIAASNLTRHKLRTALTMLGMIFGVAAVLAMLSIGAGAEDEALALIRRLGLRNIVVRAKQFEPDQLAALRQDSPGLSRQDVSALRRALPEGTLVVGKRVLRASLVASPHGRSDSRVLGVGSLYHRVSNLEIVQGSFFLPADEENAHQYCVLGTTASRKLFGLTDPLGQPVKIDQHWFTVVGLLADQVIEEGEFEGVKIENPNNDIYVPLATLLAKYDRDPVADELDEIVIQLPAGADIPEQAAAVSALMGSMHRQIDDFSLVVPQELLQQKSHTQRIFNIVMGAIASISLLVGGIGIMNIMLASVLERTSEIGLRRALGARKRDISRQFILEALAISISGALLGIALGFGISHLVASYSGWPTIIRPFSILLGVGVSMTIGLVFGIYPARQAAGVSPIEALRYE